MTLKTSCFSVSGAIIKADIRKYWGIPLLSTIVLFLQTAFYVLVNYRDIMSGEVDYQVASSIQSMLNHSNPVSLFWICVISVGAAMLVFSYLMSSGSVMSVHSQPFTRSILINSHSISAFLFSAVPMFICGLLLLVLARPVYYPEDYYSSGAEMENLFDRMEVLQWMWENLVVILFVLAISIAAAMITGTVLHHGIAAVGFNIVVPACLVLLSWHMSIFLSGYTVDSSFYEMVSTTIPAAEAIWHGISAVESVVYILISVAIYIGAVFLYRRRRVERATDGVVFRSVGVIITWIFGYLGMSICGFLAYEIFSSHFLTITGYVIGAVLGMIICRMIIMKTAKVMNRNTLKIMGVFGIAAVLFFAVLMVSDNWYSKSKPAVSEIGSVEVYDSNLLNKGYDAISSDACIEVKTEEGIKAVMALQDVLVENKADNYTTNNSDSMTITYRDKSGRVLFSRVLKYLLNRSNLEAVHEAELAVLTLPEVKQNLIDRFSEKDAIKDVISLWMGDFGETDSNYMSTPLNKDLDELAKAVVADLEKKDYEDMFNNSRFSVLTLKLQMNTTKEDIDALRTELNREPMENEIRRVDEMATVYVSADDENVINWMTEHGINYLDYIDYNCDMAVIYSDGGMDPDYGGDNPYNLSEDGTTGDYEDRSYDAPVADGSHILVGKEKIPELVKYLYRYDRTDGVDSSLYSGVTFLFRDSGGNNYATTRAYIKKSDIAHFAAA